MHTTRMHTHTHTHTHTIIYPQWLLNTWFSNYNIIWGLVWWNWFLPSHKTFYSVFVKVIQTSVNRQSLSCLMQSLKDLDESGTNSEQKIWHYHSHLSELLPCVCTNRRTDDKHKTTNMKLWFISHHFLAATGHEACSKQFPYSQD